jgi:S1-C subfamily serine protease
MPANNSLTVLSDTLASLVERSAAGLLAIDSGGRWSTSGIHWRAGVVVTAEQSLTRDDDITITLPGGRSAPATLAGRDPTTDIAVLRFQPDGMPTAELGQAQAVRAGQLAMVVGRHEEGPIACVGAVGFVGGAWRSRRGGSIDSYIRLDLNLSRSAEGGAVVDTEGRVIGLAVSGRRRRVLVIPRSTIDRAVDILLARGHVPRGYLGAGLQPVRLGGSGETAEPTGGVLINRVDPDGPAGRAGLLVGDIVTTWNGVRVSRVREVMLMLGSDSVGTSVRLAVLRGGTSHDADVMIGERPSSGKT